MKKRLGLIFMAFALICVGLVSQASATSVKEYAIIINLAGRQRMLTQKMSKEMLFIAKGYNVEANKAALKKTSALFDSTLKGLINGNKSMGLPPTKAKSTLSVMKKVDKLWGEFKGVVDGVLGGASVPVAKVASLNLPLLKTMNKAVRLYERSAKKEVHMNAGVVINLSGKQRMLTQKMSKEILLVAIGNDTDSNKMNLKKTANLFDKTLKGLKSGDSDLGLPGTKDPAIIAQLGKVTKLWAQMKPLTDKVSDIDSTGVDTATLDGMAKINIPLLKEMNKAVKMYEKAQ